MHKFKVGDRVTYLGYETSERDGQTVVFDKRKRWPATVKEVHADQKQKYRHYLIVVPDLLPGNSRGGSEYEVYVERDGVKPI